MCDDNVNKSATVNSSDTSKYFRTSLSTDNIYAQNIQENVLSLLPPHTTNNCRLLKLVLPHFYGVVLEWYSLWDSYKSTIHCHYTKTPIHIFGYLKAPRHCHTNYSRINTYKCKLRNSKIFALRTIWSTAKNYQCTHESTYGTFCSQR